MGILQLKLNLPATLLDKVKEQQVREVLQFIVTRVRAQVQDLGHRRGSRLDHRASLIYRRILYYSTMPQREGVGPLPQRFSTY